MDFEAYLRWNYNLTPDDVYPANTPGYWYIKSPPPDASTDEIWSRQYATVHGVFPRTVTYRDSRRDARGRWTSPYRTWRQARGESVS